jgi:hypothetical protein
MALPLAASAQTQPPSTPPPQQTQPKPEPQPAQPQPQPAQQQPQPQAQPQPAQPEPQPAQSQPQATQPADAKPADAKIDAASAKRHLSEARDALSQLAALPEAARLQGAARTQISQVISNFNELITTQSDWRAAYAKVDAGVTALLGPDQPAPATGVAGAVGTSGAATIELDPAIRAKLVEFRTHMKEFERAAGSNASGAMAPSAATGATANPANPTTLAAGTSGVMPSSPTADMAAADQAKASEQVDHAEANKHLDAISEILNKSKTGTLTRTQTAELKKHVEELRQVLQQSK